MIVSLSARLGRRFEGLLSPELNVVVLLSLFCVVVTVLQTEQALRGRAEALREASLQAAHLAESLDRDISSKIEVSEAILDGLADRVETDSQTTRTRLELRQFLMQSVTKLPLAHGLFIWNANGESIASSQPTPSPNYTVGDREYMRYHREHDDDQVHVGPANRARSTGDWVFPVSRRFNDARGNFAGVALATIRIGALQHVYEGLPLGEKGEAILALAGGPILVRQPAGAEIVGQSLYRRNFLPRDLSPGSTIGFEARSPFDGVRRIFAVRWDRDKSVILVVGLSKAEILAPWEARTLVQLALTILIILVVAAVGLRLVTQLRRQRRADALLQASDRLHRQLAEAAASANRAKSDFLANMSHEIRTPLNGVLAIAQVMALGELTAEQHRNLDIIRSSGKDLLHVINDILDFSKIEAGKLEVENVEFDAAEVIANCVEGFSAVAKRKNITLQFEQSETSAGIRLGDPARLRQILNNFLSNAMKFTSDGGVFVALDAIGEDGGEGVKLTVRDTGMGIPADKLSLLFEKFVQVDSSTTRQFGGTGLGLAICRQLAGLMGGEVWATSELGIGSTFNVTLGFPRVADHPGAPAPVTADKPSDDSVRSLRILAAEDNPTNQIVLSTIIATLGWDLKIVGNGREAVDAWAAETFDVILMDIQMPELDGVAATKLIREAEIERSLPRIPIIALTANAYTHQVSDYRDAGMDAHVAKPIELVDLYEVLEAVIDRTTA